MARGVNKWIGVGNLGDDPEVKAMPNGNAVTNISVATSESWKDKDGQQQERTEWHRIVFFNKLAEIAGEYLRKGSKVYIEGALRTRKWQDQSGADRYTTEIVASEMQMLDSRGDSPSAQTPSAPAPAPKQYVMTPKAEGFTREQYNSQGWTDEALIKDGYMEVRIAAPQAPSAPQAPGIDDFDDDIQF